MEGQEVRWSTFHAPINVYRCFGWLLKGAQNWISKDHFKLNHGGYEILKPKMKSGSPKNEEIDVSRFKDINIHFAGDVYLLAVWIAMSDRAKSTSTSKRRTTLTGLAAKFLSIYGIDYDNPIGPEDVMKIFERHGIRGNPLLCLDEASESSMTLSLAPGDNLSSKKLVK